MEKPVLNKNQFVHAVFRIAEECGLVESFVRVFPATPERRMRPRKTIKLTGLAKLIFKLTAIGYNINC